MLRTDLLGAWSGWLTPVFEPRRYRTWFFVAALPEGQVTRDVSTESSSVDWLPAMRGGRGRSRTAQILMLPPTCLTCLDVAQHPTPTPCSREARERTVEMFTPEVVVSGEDFVLSIPPRYETCWHGIDRAGR